RTLTGIQGIAMPVDWDDDESSDLDDAAYDEDATVACPHCGADVYEDAPCCSTCGQYMTPDASPWSERPWWWTALGLAGVAAAILGLLLAAGG
ncbi:MAG: hypothetical protein KDA41_15335, partial [Planctomycetales bacterium]|nr:hypothetical protein [Planctomycetales bacterium]